MSAKFDELVSYFAPTVGAERGAEILRDAARERGWSIEQLDDEKTDSLLAYLATRPGIVGVTARFASQRRAAKRPTPTEAGRTTAPERTPPSGTKSRGDVPVTTIEELLAASLDATRARQVVAEYWQLAGLTGTRCSTEQALALLDRMAVAGGNVGVAATFAKARWHLRRA